MSAQSGISGLPDKLANTLDTLEMFPTAVSGSSF